ncbi:hydroxymethylglutaryl-CoA synthase [Enterococcus timonensis]|uniref:hydroxymethylglutaryl-CoA synthase n=1 Tax=Enterococcus timonensis TaxID=1852364 RepID=UPI0008D9EA6F|nr:hydroxymethylglutaryl-CoA synthase [Enterococcus timonensis]
MTLGIDGISFFVPPFYLPLTDLALARKVDPNKYTIGIGQEKMAVAPVSQDIITWGANAAKDVLVGENVENLAMVIFATESSLDESKAAGVVLHRLLKLPKFVRTLEIKQACYGGTAALMLAKDFVAVHPGKKVLVVMSDHARYGLNSGGEVTQGAGAVALLVSENPKILAINDDSVSMTADINDFYRPTGEKFPIVDGPLSNATYIEMFADLWQTYQQQTGLDFADFSALVFHLPYAKMGQKALRPQLENAPEKVQTQLMDNYQLSTLYCRQVGNLYTGSLYLSLLSLLEQSENLQAGLRLGFFSYGSGAVGEFFSGVLQPNFASFLNQEKDAKMLANRQAISVTEYEKMFSEHLSEELTLNDPTLFSVADFNGEVRNYRS